LLLISLFFLNLFFLVSTFFLTAMTSALRTIRSKNSKKQINSISALFFYRRFHTFFFPHREFEGIFFSCICAQNITRFCYAATAVFFLIETDLFKSTLTFDGRWLIQPVSWFWIVLSFVLFIFFSFLIGDYLARLFGTRFPEAAFRLSAPISSLFLFLSFPVSFIFLKLSQSVSRLIYIDHIQEPVTQVKQEIIELIQKARIGSTIELHDKKLIESVLTFRDRIAREVMVPRVDLFSLSADTTIKEAARLLEPEGYSRTPVYRNTVDNVIGVLMYKDVLAKYMEYEQNGQDPKILQAPIESIQKSVLYAPETKKLSILLQEFRKKKVHLAIVVDEYGGTEGIVTIEDILEEIVGEIADEYDNEEDLFRTLPDGSWIVDARMNLLDVEEQLDITIPQNENYDTISGYIYYCAGTIPSKGFTIHHTDFELEVLSSDEKSVEKVRIKPIFEET